MSCNRTYDLSGRARVFCRKKNHPPPNEEQISFKNKDQMKKCPGFNSYKHS